MSWGNSGLPGGSHESGMTVSRSQNLSPVVGAVYLLPAERAVLAQARVKARGWHG